MIKKYLLAFCFVLIIFFSLVDIKEIDISEILNSEYEVEIKGEVNNPGVYKTNRNETLNDLLDKAKITENSDISALNLTSSLTRGQVIVIPNIKDVKENRISINTADVKELDTLPGIGEAIALRIIEYRENSGGFKTLEELKNVSGIGDKTYEKIKDLITL